MSFPSQKSLVTNTNNKASNGRVFTVAMYEGKNIHYSPIDQKPLCSFSGKVCNQRRLNKYGFCVRHILEDSDAPFKRCAYVAKSSKQTCTQPIPRKEERQYCNNHMQVLGMLPKKERKPKKEKEKERELQGAVLSAHLEQKHLFQNQIRSRLAVDSIKNQIALIQNSVGRDDVEDVYAFPTDPGERSERINPVSTVITNSTIPTASAGIGMTKSVSVSAGDSTSSGSSSLAKMYPELAEKLEKIKPKLETKVKGKVKSSRTMNSLQTKIAQNKIKDKLKRNQESSASSQSQSPSSSFNSANSPGFHINTSSPSVQQSESPATPVMTSQKVSSASEDISAKNKVTVAASLVTDSAHPRTTSITTLPTITQINPLNSFNFPNVNFNFGHFGIPLPTASDVQETLKQLAKTTHIPLEAALFSPEGAGLVPRLPIAGLPAGTLIPTADLLTLHHLLRPQLSGPPPPYPGTQPRPSFPLLTSVPTLNVPNQQSDEKRVNQTIVSKEEQTKSSELTKQKSVSLSQSSSTVTTHSVSSVKPSVSASQSTTSNPVKTPKTRAARSRVSPASRSSKATTMAMYSLPVTLGKPRKLKNVLSETDVKRIKTESAKNFYRIHKKRRLENHNFLVSGFGSSDSDSSDCDMLPWQPDWFTASSDEEQGEEDEEDLSFDLRTTKLALSRARLRRQCFQSKKSYIANSNVHDGDTKSLTSLIAAVRENTRVAVQSLYEVSGNRPKPVDKYKRRGLERRRCCYKNDEEVQCKNIIVPYTNHCIKHVMYNVDQQMFEYCTAKFADNTQCCVPVIDLKHELPLCMEHGIKADNYQKLQDSEPKPKRPRKKTKPSALTRPPKKGKKKRNQRKPARQQKPLPQEDYAEDTELGDSEDVHTASHDDDGEDEEEEEDGDKTEPEEETPVKEMPSKMAILAATTPTIRPKVQQAEPAVKETSLSKTEKFQKVSSLEELENLGGLPELENEKMFGELPLETASKLLEENDFQDVLNRLPDETFDLFTNKNGMFEPTNEEVEELEQSIAMANKDYKYAKDSLDEISTSNTPLPPILDDTDELTKQIAEEILSGSLGREMSSHSFNSADAQESIKAIARSLSTSGQLLAPQSAARLESPQTTAQRQASCPPSVPVPLPFTQHQSYKEKDHVPVVSVPTISSSSQSFSQASCSSNRSTTSFSSQPSSASLSSESVTMRPSLLPVTNSLPASYVASPKHVEPVSTPRSADRILTTDSSTVRYPTNLPLSQQQLSQQQLLQFMQQSVQHPPPVQYQTAPPPPQRPVHLSQIPGAQLSQQIPAAQVPQQLTAEQLLEKQRFIQQQKQQLEAQQQQLTQQQQHLEALTQQQQQLDAQLLQQHLLQRLSNTRPPQQVAVSSVEQQVANKFQEKSQATTTTIAMAKSVAHATQVTSLPSLSRYVNSISQVPAPMLPQDLKSNPALQTAHLLELQQQLAIFAQQQQQLLAQQNITGLNKVTYGNTHVLAPSQTAAMQKSVQKSQLESSSHSKVKTSATAPVSLPAMNQPVFSHKPLVHELPPKTVANVVSSKPQTSQVQYIPPKQGSVSVTLSGVGSVTDRVVPHTDTTTPHSVRTNTPTTGGETSSFSSQTQTVSSPSSLLSKIDPKTMTTKALEQHIVQMAYQQALAKQTEVDLERSKNPKKVGAKKNSQKGVKRNASSAKKVKDTTKTPEMLSRQSELEQQLAQLAKQNMAQKHAAQKNAIVNPSLSHTSTALLKQVTNRTATISWKPIPTCQNGVSEDSKDTYVSVGNSIMSFGTSRSVASPAVSSVPFTAASPLSARPVSKHLVPPPSYHHTMTATLTKSSTTPS